jgi:mitogen-activated protein kinase kinase
MKLLKLCKSRYIVEFFGSFVHEGDISICMEYVDIGSFDKIVQLLPEPQVIPEIILAGVSFQALNGLLYLYTKHKVLLSPVFYNRLCIAILNLAISS